MSTDLLAADYRGRTLVFFAVGGSGIRAVEPLLHLCALGLGPGQLRILLIDPDQANAAVARTRRLIDLYRAARERLAAAGAAHPFFRTEVLDVVGDLPVWSPIADDDFLADPTFAGCVDRSLMDHSAAAVGALCDLLNARRVREMNLAMGFRGIPSVGTVFMNRLRSQPFFATLLEQYQANQAGTVFFAGGSIFGGTGAAGLPVVGRALRDGVTGVEGRADVRGAPRTRVGAALFLPYFTLPAAAGTDDGAPRPENALFAHNAAGALPTYVDRASELGYGGYYLLGDGRPRVQERNEVGGEAQANRAHYVELFAAFAALDFAARGGEDANDALPVFRGIGVSGEEVGWEDLPLTPASRQALKGALVAMHTFLSVFRPNGGAAADLADSLRGVTWHWLLRLRAPVWTEQSDVLDGVGRFWAETWQWLRELRTASPALRLAGVDQRPPARTGTHELIEGFGRAGAAGRRADDVYDVFRAWNVAAYARRNGGFPAFVRVLGEGSERFAADRFPEADLAPAENS